MEPVTAAPVRPRRVVVLLLDSLSRAMLGAYGGGEFDTPNLDRLAAGAVRFQNHYAGSLPCIPARHDLFCGALDFLWRPWGSIEVWEEPITAALRRTGVVTKLVTDHPHLFEVGGENYHCDFTAWEYQRGHESDPWQTRPDPSWVGAPTFGRGHMPYDDSRGHFAGEEDFPGPRTMAAAAEWLGCHGPHHERFLLVVDEFDPHEPFDTPEPYCSLYDAGWEGPHLVWPPYVVGGLRNGLLDEAKARQVRAQYGAKLTMIDAWFGRVLDALDDAGLRSTTAVVVVTDHGHYLGEKDIWGKPGSPVYRTLGHIPLLVSWPGVEPRDEQALTTTVDLAATLLDLFDARVGHRIHGRTLLPLLEGTAGAVREHALFGYWGREVQVTDGTIKYSRGAARDNFPLALWSNRWSTMPVPYLPDLRLPPPDARAALERMPGSEVPVIRQPYEPGDRLPFWAAGGPGATELFDLSADPDELRNLAGTKAEAEAADLLRVALSEVEAPPEQLERLGLT